METEFRAESLAIADTLKAHCEQKGVSLAHFATAWVLANKAVSAVIAGPRTLAQWQDYFGALDCVISAEDEARSTRWSGRAIRPRRATTTETRSKGAEGASPNRRRVLGSAALLSMKVSAMPNTSTAGIEVVETSATVLAQALAAGRIGAEALVQACLGASPPSTAVART